MDVIIKPYEDKYKAEVIGVLKRNFSGMEKSTDEELFNWLKPIITYNWLIEEDFKSLAYPRGAVLLAQDKVVGFLGLIYSRRYIHGKSQIYLNPSTWAIDNDYRDNIFEVMEEILKTADIVSDFTPSPSMLKICMDYFGFKCINAIQFIFFPIPKKSVSVRMQEIVNAKDYTDKEQEAFQIFNDHRDFDLKCARFAFKKKTGFVFYIIKCRKWKNLIPVKVIRIVKIINTELFSTHVHDIVWQLQKKKMGISQFT